MMMMRCCRSRNHLRIVAVLIWCLSFFLASSLQQHQPPADNDFLTTDSVVLITGAANYLGSELALALQRTYQPKKIILVDDLSQQQQQQPSSSSNGNNMEQELLEIKRRRLFQILQEGAARAPGSVHLYRVDLRSPMLEFYDTARVSVLEHVFQRHADITHIVHLASYQQIDDDGDGSGSGSLLGPPREVISTGPKAGLLESLLEHMYKHANETGRAAPPHFTYASSVSVYPRNSAAAAGAAGATAAPWTENSVLQPKQQQMHHPAVPSTWYGASRLLDERLVHAYHDMYPQLYSVGLRFSTVYGPAADPSTPIHLLAQRAVLLSATTNATTSAPPPPLPDDMHPEDERDYIYIDDAVDAILSGMQFRPIGVTNPAPVVFNVASGQTTSIQDVAQQMETAIPGTKVMPLVKTKQNKLPRSHRPPIHVSIQRAQTWLGFQPRVSLDQGIQQTLAWHYDQVHPHGLSQVEVSASAFSEELVAKGVAGCDPFDKECLHGMPILPCVSECSNQRQCQATVWDSVMEYTNRLTTACPSVLYTVALLPFNDDFLSANVQVSPDSQQSHFENSNCNIAFVSAQHVAIKRLETAAQQSTTARSLKTATGAADNTFLRRTPLRFGPWTLVPVSIPKIMLTRDHLKSWTELSLLPKLSPGRFFKASETAIYIDPNVIVENLSSLLFQMDMRPTHPDFATQVDARTVMLMGKAEPSWSSRTATTQQQTGVVPEQQAAYRMFHIKSMDFFASSEEDGFGQNVDSSFIVHRLQIHDSQRFRCDVLSEIVQWGDSYQKIALRDEAAFAFVMGLHDWSSLVASKSKRRENDDGQASPCWWRSASVQTIPASIAHRRLEEVVKATPPKIQVLSVDETGVGEAAPVQDNTIDKSRNFEVLLDDTSDVADAGIIEEHAGQAPIVQVSDVQFLSDESAGTDLADDTNQETGADDNDEEADEGESNVSPEQHRLPPSLTSDEEEEDNDEEDIDPSMEDVPHYDSVNGFGVERVSIAIKKQRHDGYSPETDVEDDDDDDHDSRDKEKEVEGGSFHVDAADPSSYDVWMAVRSSSDDVRYFVRLVPADVVGVVRIR